MLVDHPGLRLLQHELRDHHDIRVDPHAPPDELALVMLVPIEQTCDCAIESATRRKKRASPRNTVLVELLEDAIITTQVFEHR
jgi:hypothetical protein